jgi:hypothetical protein
VVNLLRSIVFWVVSMSNLVDVYKRLGEICLYLQGLKAMINTSDVDNPEYEGNTFLRDFGKHIPDYTAAHPRRQ